MNGRELFLRPWMQKYCCAFSIFTWALIHQTLATHTVSSACLSLLYPLPDSLFGWVRISRLEMIFSQNWKTLLYCLSVPSFHCWYREVQLLPGFLILGLWPVFLLSRTFGNPFLSWGSSILNYVLWGESCCCCCVEHLLGPFHMEIQIFHYGKLWRNYLFG